MIQRLLYAILYVCYPVIKISLKRLFQLRVAGLEHLSLQGPTVLIPNHVSLWDAVLLGLILPPEVTFVVNTEIARRFAWILKLRKHIPVNPLNPYSVRQMVKTVQKGVPLVIFPEGRVTTSGGMMKVYGGIGYVALRTQARMIPVAIHGLEYSKLSYMKNKIRQSWFPNVSITFGEAFSLGLRSGVSMRVQKEKATCEIEKKMQNHLFTSKMKPKLNLFNEMLTEAKRNGYGAPICQDAVSLGGTDNGGTASIPVSLTYRMLMTNAYVLANGLKRQLAGQERVALLMPNSAANVVTVFSLFRLGVTPAFLNYSAGKQNMIDACETANVRTVLTSKAFVEKAGLAPVIEELRASRSVLFLEEVKDALTLRDKLGGLIDSWLGKKGPLDNNEVILFTSGSESRPKGVVLTHRNLYANVQQARSVIAFHAADIVFNAMPMFHSFGLTAGTLLPVLSGMKVIMYPNPLHYKVIPELVYDKNATIMFGTSTFLAAYARTAHAYDFAHSLKYVVAGAERLKEEVRQLWMDKFGVRILEGYGTTETAPVLSLNTPKYYRKGTVGQILPGIEYRLEPVPGIEDGGNLLVKGPNVMKGYLIHGKGFVPCPEWYDCGDVVSRDEDGFLMIKARLKRFAKIGGEMVSLQMVEEVAAAWLPEIACAAISMPDGRKGERIVLYHNSQGARLQELKEYMKNQGQSQLLAPSQLIYMEKLPLLGSGKTDYVTLKQWSEQENERGGEAV